MKGDKTRIFADDLLVQSYFSVVTVSHKCFTSVDSGAPRPREARASGASYQRKFGNLSIQELITIK